MKVAAFISLALALLTVAPPMTFAMSGVRGGASSTMIMLRRSSFRRLDDDVDAPEERECEFSYDTDEIEFECKVKSESNETKIKDEIEYKVETKGDKGLKVQVEYEQEIETDETETESETQYKIFFDRIIEYSKADDDAPSEAYDWESDTVVQTIFLSQWSDFSKIADDGVSASFYVTSGVANFTFTVSRAALGEALTANKMKIDVRIVDFPWVDDDTYVALLSTIESSKEVEVEYEDSDLDTAEDVVISFEDATDTIGFIPFGEYTWAKTATVTTNATEDTTTSTNAPPSSSNLTQLVESTIEVIATSPTNLGNATVKPMAFSFIGSAASMASDIYWDPEAGIGYSGRSGATQLISFLGVAGGLLSALLLLA